MYRMNQFDIHTSDITLSEDYVNLWIDTWTMNSMISIIRRSQN